MGRRSTISINLRPHIVRATLIACMVTSFFAGGICSNAADSNQATGVNLSGQPVDPLKTANGKVTVLIFVRTDCPISNRYAPTIQRLSAQFAGRSTFWLIYPAKSETSGSIQQHLKQYGYKLGALQDPQHTLIKASHVEVTPEAAVFNASGDLVYHGRIDNWYEDFGHARTVPTTHELADAISAVLNGRRPTVNSSPAIGCYISDLQ